MVLEQNTGDVYYVRIVAFMEIRFHSATTKRKLWRQSTTAVSYFSFHLMAIVCVIAYLLLN